MEKVITFTSNSELGRLRTISVKFGYTLDECFTISHNRDIMKTYYYELNYIGGKKGDIIMSTLNSIPEFTGTSNMSGIELVSESKITYKVK